MATVNVETTVDVLDVIDLADDGDLIDELMDRGYSVQKEEFNVDVFDREDINYLLERISDVDWQGRRVYDKLKRLRFG